MNTSGTEPDKSVMVWVSQTLHSLKTTVDVTTLKDSRNNHKNDSSRDGQTNRHGHQDDANTTHSLHILTNILYNKTYKLPSLLYSL